MMMFTYILALLVGFTFADGSLMDTCSGWSLWHPQDQVWYLQGHCKDNGGNSICSRASLDA